MSVAIDRMCEEYDVPSTVIVKSSSGSNGLQARASQLAPFGPSMEAIASRHLQVHRLLYGQTCRISVKERSQFPSKWIPSKRWLRGSTPSFTNSFTISSITISTSTQMITARRLGDGEEHQRSVRYLLRSRHE